MAFVTEDLRKSRYDIDDEVLRPYFPLDQVLEDLLDLPEFEDRVLRFGFSIRLVLLPLLEAHVLHQPLDLLSFSALLVLVDPAAPNSVGEYAPSWRREPVQ